MEQSLSTRDIVLIIIGTIPALITLLITEIFHWSRETRLFLLNKYEVAIDSLSADHIIVSKYIDRTLGLFNEFELLTSIVPNPTAFVEIKRSLDTFEADITELNKALWKIDIVKTLDSAIVQIIDNYLIQRLVATNELEKIYKAVSSNRRGDDFDCLESFKITYNEASNDLLNALHTKTKMARNNPVIKSYKRIKALFANR